MNVEAGGGNKKEKSHGQTETGTTTEDAIKITGERIATIKADMEK